MIMIDVSHVVINDRVFKVEDIKSALTSCKKNKASGYNQVYYENLIYGGILLLQVLRKLFNAMNEFAYCPVNLKRGKSLLFTRVGNKKKYDPNSYRAISLCSMILKLYEKVLLSYMGSEVELNSPKKFKLRINIFHGS